VAHERRRDCKIERSQKRQFAHFHPPFPVTEESSLESMPQAEAWRVRHSKIVAPSGPEASPRDSTAARGGWTWRVFEFFAGTALTRSTRKTFRTLRAAAWSVSSTKSRSRFFADMQGPRSDGAAAGGGPGCCAAGSWFVITTRKSDRRFRHG